MTTRILMPIVTPELVLPNAPNDIKTMRVCPENTVRYCAVLVVAVLLLASPLFATNAVYLANASAGANDGSSCANAKAATYFNTGGNWSATPTGIQIGPDTTVHLCGTITGSAGGTLFTAQGSGTSGHPITILWESGAILTATYWSTTTGAINLTGKSWIVLDGGGTGTPWTLASGGDPSTHGANGIIQCTANGTSLANQQETIMVLVDSTSHITLQHLWFKDSYVRVANTNGSAGFDSSVIDGTNATDIRATYNWFTNGRLALGEIFNVDGQNFDFDHNYTFAIEVPLALGDSTTATWTSSLVHDNHFAGGVDQWDDPASNSFHHDGCCHYNAQAGGHINGFQVYNNLTDGIWGNDSAFYISSGGLTHITTYVYPEDTGGDTTIFNNVFDTSAGTANLTASVNGSIFCKVTGSPGASCAVYNNTFVGKTGNSTNNIIFETDGGTSASTALFKNNIVTYQGGPVYLGGGADSTATFRSNVYYQQGSSNWNADTFANWQAAGQDAGGSPGTVNGSDPKLNSNFTLQSGSPAIGKVTDLTSLGITALNSDAAGVARPSGSNWDAGAFQFASGCTPSKVVYTAQPSNAEVGSTLGTVSVSVEDSGGNVCTSDTSTVTLSSHSGSTAATLQSSSSLSKAASGGVATWADLFVSPTTGTISIDAADGALTGATSSSVTISCTPSKVVFTSQPGSTTIGSSLGPVTVAVQDSASITCSADTSSVTIANKAATCTGMSLSGTATGNNIFSTSNLTENAAGACTLHATDGALTAADSSAFTISATAGGSTRGRMHRP